MKFFLLFFIRAYQLALAPLLGSNCRFHPNCSAYASEAVTTHGAIKGSMLTTRRLLRCHPFAKPGIDNVPNL